MSLSILSHLMLLYVIHMGQESVNQDTIFLLRDIYRIYFVYIVPNILLCGYHMLTQRSDMRLVVVTTS